MNLIDLLLILIVLLSMWAGWSKGFIVGITDLLIWLGSLAIGFVFYEAAGQLLHKALPTLGVWNLPLAFIALLLLSRIMLSLVFYRFFVRPTSPETHRAPANRFFGLLPGLVTGAIYAAITAAVVLSIPAWRGLANEARESQIAARLGGQVAWLDEKFSPIFGDVAKETVKRVTAEPSSAETVDLHYKVKNLKARAELEEQMLVLVNEERTKRGLKPLRPDPEMTKVARAHSTDMFVRGYFSHYTPERKDPFDRMKEAGVKFTTAGENLALGRTLKICHEGLMNSPGHRANILSPAFGRLGIGIMDGGLYGLMISQEFRN